MINMCEDFTDDGLNITSSKATVITNYTVTNHSQLFRDHTNIMQNMSDRNTFSIGKFLCADTTIRRPLSKSEREHRKKIKAISKASKKRNRK